MTDAISDQERYHGKEVGVGGPEVFTSKELVELAFKVSRLPTVIKSISPWMLKTAAKATKPFNENVSSYLQYANVSIGQDGVGTPFGNHRLADFFQEVYVGAETVSISHLT